MLKAAVSIVVHVFSAHMSTFVLKWEWSVGASIDVRLPLLQTAKLICNMTVPFYIFTAMHERSSWSVDLTFGTVGLFDSSHSGGYPRRLLNLRGKHLVLRILHVFKVDFSLGELPPHTFCTRGENGLAFAPSSMCPALPR